MSMISKKRLFLSFFLSLLFISNSYTQNTIGNIQNHIKNIVSIGPRQAGSKADKKVGDYILKELKQAGLKAQTETFSFESFTLASLRVSIGEQDIKYEAIGMNPYSDEHNFNEEAIFVSMNDDDFPDIDSKIVFCDDQRLYFSAMVRNPKMLIFISAEDLIKYRAQDNHSCSIEVEGQITEYSSRNIILDIGPEDAEQEIWVSAHYDGYMQFPAANDNATGTASLIEIAKLVAKGKPSKYKFRFIWFGAEELGIVGSRNYVEKHYSELKNCKLLINLDTFGGDEGPVIAGLQGQNPREDFSFNGFPPVIKNRSIESMKGNWRILDPGIISLFTSACCSDEVKEMVKAASAATHIDYIERSLLSDQSSFGSANIPAISIQSSKHHIHSSEDTFENTNWETVMKCYDLTIGLLGLAIDSE